MKHLLNIILSSLSGFITVVYLLSQFEYLENSIVYHLLFSLPIIVLMSGISYIFVYRGNLKPTPKEIIVVLILFVISVILCRYFLFNYHGYKVISWILVLLITVFALLVLKKSWKENE